MKNIYFIFIDSSMTEKKLEEHSKDVYQRLEKAEQIGGVIMLPPNVRKIDVVPKPQ